MLCKKNNAENSSDTKACSDQSGFLGLWHGQQRVNISRIVGVAMRYDFIGY